MNLFAAVHQPESDAQCYPRRREVRMGHFPGAN
jgi:hypothetical protein